MQIFIAGVMQGSRLDRYIDDQDYRSTIAQVILDLHPEFEVVDPNELHPNGVDYDDELAKATLLEMAGLAGQADLVVAYAPQASMGTAIEMWQAHGAGAKILTVSPMGDNWVIKFLSDRVFPTTDHLAEFIASGGLLELSDER